MKRVAYIVISGASSSRAAKCPRLSDASPMGRTKNELLKIPLHGALETTAPAAQHPLRLMRYDYADAYDTL
jgi:hypothetical protein